MQRNTIASDRAVALSEMAIRRFPFAPEMILPLRQGFGTPAKPVVREGQEVVRGEPIAEPVEFLSVAMHAPATGVIDRIDECVLASGETEPAIFLRVYPGAGQEILYGSPIDVEALSPAAIVQAIRDAGIVGQGGVGFPTHAKLELPPDRAVETLVVNAFEPGAGLTMARRVLLDRTRELVQGLRLAIKASGAQRTVVALPAGQDDLVAALRKALPADGSIEIVGPSGRFPQAAEKALVQAVLGREIPEDGLPLDVGAAVLHVATLAQIGELLPRQGGLIERVVTFAGDGIGRPGNYLVPVGTPLAFALEQVALKPGAVQIDMGVAVKERNVPITKDVPGIRVGQPVAAPDSSGNGKTSGGLRLLLGRMFGK